MSALTAPAEGTADTPEEIADELCEAVLAVDHVDYNSLTVDELEDLLAARNTVEDLCLRYRREASPYGGVDDSKVTPTDV